MKASTTLLTGLIILAAGIILIISKNAITGTGIVTTAGILFLLSGIINAVLYLSSKNSDGTHKRSTASRFFGTIVSIASLLLGVSMLIFTATFAKLVPILFGLLLAFGAIIQFYIIALGARPVKMPAWTYAFPGVILVESMIVFFAGLAEPNLMLVTGTGLVVFGIAGFVESVLLGAGHRQLRHQARQDVTSNAVVDLKASDVKEIKGLDD